MSVRSQSKPRVAAAQKASGVLIACVGVWACSDDQPGGVGVSTQNPAIDVGDDSSESPAPAAESPSSVSTPNEGSLPPQNADVPPDDSAQATPGGPPDATSTVWALSLAVTPDSITHDGQQTARVEATLQAPAGASTDDAWVQLDLTALGRRDDLTMRDDEIGGDLVAGDGVFTFEMVVENSEQLGDYPLRARAQVDGVVIAEGQSLLNVAAPNCVADCSNKHCGDDGCGGDCGVCPRGAACTDGFCPDVTEAVMVFIPGGTFMMGTDDYPESSPPQQVQVADFWLDDTEVTAGAYTRCVEEGGCTARGIGGAYSYGSVNKETHPVNDVSWDDATAYCERMGKRLPTEVEWEYAAGGRQGFQYPWGDNPPEDQLCWQRPGGDFTATCPVASFPPNENGLYDMAGNVWEWTSTAWCSYSSDDPDNYAACGETNRVDRGGGWNNLENDFVRVQYRRGFVTTKRTYLLGFRCASSTDPSAQ